MTMLDAPRATPVLDELLADLRALVETESPSSDLAAVERSADVVARIGAERLGVAAERVVIDGVHHVRWRFGPRDSGRVLLLAHHDTVWPLGTLARTPFSVTDGVLRGPGCFDMLAGLVMAFHAVAQLHERDGVTLLVTGDEELGSSSSRAVIEEEARRSAAVLVLESPASDGALKTARKGTSLYEVEIVGRAAHAGLEPEKGLNATLELAHQVQVVAALADEQVGTTVTPTTATSGTTVNTVPAGGRFSVDVRAWTTAELQRVDDALHALTAVLPGAELRVHGAVNRLPLEDSSSRPLFERAQGVASRLGLPALSQAAVGGASDGNFTAGLGTPTLDGLGCPGGGAHAEDEHVLVDRLVDRTLLVRGLIEDLLSASENSAPGAAG